MVVCKCRKATKLYCFVHKVPVCGECVCFDEHKICVVRSYSEWVIDGDYDWPPKCCSCNSVLEEGAGSPTIRLGCLHVMHTSCLISHIKNFPPHTAPAGYVCPSCSTVIWPPKIVKDPGSLHHSKLKELIMQTGLGNQFFGDHAMSLWAPPPAFVSDPLVSISSSSLLTEDKCSPAGEYQAEMKNAPSESEITEIDDLESAENFAKSSVTGPGATARKGGLHPDIQNSEITSFADDEDGNARKYNRRGPFRHKLLRALLPFWSTALPTLPVTLPARKEVANSGDGEGRTARHQKSARTDPRKILLFVAIMACMATIAILYYRIAQRGIGEEQQLELEDVEQQR